MEESKDCYVAKEKEETIWRRSLQKLSRILRSLNSGLGLETFANFWRVSVSVSENLVSGKSLGFGFGKFVILYKDEKNSCFDFIVFG